MSDSRDSAIDERVESLAQDFIERFRRGERPSPSEYAARFPDLAPQLKDLVQALAMIEQAAADSSQPPALPSSNHVPEVLGDYRLLREIGRGGMGIVFEAEQVSLSRRVAIKVLPAMINLDGNRLERFRRETRAAAQLQHEHIVPVYGVGEHDGLHYFAMQFIEGRTLDAVLEEVRRFRGGPADAIDSSGLAASSNAEYCKNVACIGRDIAAALAYAHGRHVLHRDVKPANLLLDQQARAWLTDFGLAQSDDHHRLTCTGDIVGTLRYMAPERLNGVSDPRGDVYALGMTLYEMLTLRPAFDENSRERLIRQILDDEPASPRRIDPRIPPDLETIVLKAIAKDLTDRYDSAERLADDLRLFLADRPIQARRTSTWERVRRWRRRNPALSWSLAATFALLATAAIGASVFAWRSHRDRLQIAATERDARRALFDSLLAQAGDIRRSRQIGQRFDALATIDRAVQVARSLELGDEAVSRLRDETIAALALPDARVAASHELEPAPNASEVAWSPDPRHYARVEEGDVVVRSSEGHAVLARRSRARWCWFDPTGNRLAIVQTPSDKYPQGAVVFWDWRTGVESPPALPVPYLFAFAWSPTGAKVAVGTAAGEIVLLDAQSGREASRFKSLATPSSIAFDADGIRIVVSGSGGRLSIHQAADGAAVAQLRHESQVNRAEFSLDGGSLAFSDAEGRVWLWDLAQPRPGAWMGSEADFGAHSLQFLARDSLLLSWGWDGQARIFNTNLARERLRVPGVSAVAARDAGRLAVRQGNSLVQYELNLADEFRELAWGGVAKAERLRFHRLAVSPDCRWVVASCDDGLRIWEPATSSTAALLPIGQTIELAFDAYGTALFAGHGGGVYRWPWQVESGAVRLGPPEQVLNASGVSSLEVDAANDRLVAVANRKVHLLPLKSGLPPIQPFNLAQSNTAAYSPDGGFVVGFPWNSRGVHVWDVSKGDEVQELLSATIIGTGRFSPSGATLATASDGYRFFKSSDWTLEAEASRAKGPDNPGWVDWSPEETVLATLYDQRRIRLHAWPSMRLLATLEAPEGDAIWRFEFLAGGEQLAVLCKTPGIVKIWDLRLIRQYLASRGLDWDMPAYSASSPAFDRPTTILVDLGALSPD